jgi:hypothetical protein
MMGILKFSKAVLSKLRIEVPLYSTESTSRSMYSVSVIRNNVLLSLLTLMAVMLHRNAPANHVKDGLESVSDDGSTGLFT